MRISESVFHTSTQWQINICLVFLQYLLIISSRRLTELIVGFRSFKRKRFHPSLPTWAFLIHSFQHQPFFLILLIWFFVFLLSFPVFRPPCLVFSWSIVVFSTLVLGHDKDEFGLHIQIRFLWLICLIKFDLSFTTNLVWCSNCMFAHSLRSFLNFWILFIFYLDGTIDASNLFPNQRYLYICFHSFRNNCSNLSLKWPFSTIFVSFTFLCYFFFIAAGTAIPPNPTKLQECDFQCI
jgi:hypothetical protein